MDSSLLFWGMIVSSIGLGYFVYGKKQRKGIALFSGVALLIFPYFTANIWLLLLIAIILMALPFLIRY